MLLSEAWSDSKGAAGAGSSIAWWTLASATRALTRPILHHPKTAATDAATDAPIIELVAMVKEVQQKFYLRSSRLANAEKMKL